MPSFAVILPAAGLSRRFGGIEKKPFATLHGRRVWRRSVELFRDRPDVLDIRLIVSPEDAESFRRRFGADCVSLDVAVVAGGSERFNSVANALVALPVEIDYVAVHDAVRPLATAEAIDAVFAAAVRHGAAMLAVPVADTLKRVDGATHRITETVARASLWAAQTPQVFRRDWLVDAYANRHRLEQAITDDAQLVEALGHAVFAVQGSALNFKITTQADFELAELILKGREAVSGPVGS